LRRFFDVFLFEELPARDQRSDDVYLDDVRQAAVCLGIFSNEYGAPDERGGR